MRIAVWHNLPSGGGKRALYYHVRGLVERGHHVECWCPPTADRTYLPLKEWAPEHVVPLPWDPKRSRNPVKRAWNNYSNVKDGLQAMEWHCRNCAEQMGKGNFDILLANSDQFFTVPPIARFTKFPSAIYLQEPSRALYEARPSLPWAAIPAPRTWSPVYAVHFLHNLIKVQGVRLRAREEHKNAHSYRMVLVNSVFSRESVLRAYGRLNVQVCYLGVDTELFRPLGLPRERLVLGVGALVEAKGLRFVTEAVSLMPEPHPRFIWLGNLAEEGFVEQIEHFATSRGVQIDLRQMVPDDELLNWLNRACVLAYAPHLEPFGYAPLEANATGLPVVAVAEGGVKETVVDGINGLVVAAEPSAMAAALTRLLDDTSYAEQLGVQGRRLVEEEWSVQESVARLESYLGQMLQGQLAKSRESAGE